MATVADVYGVLVRSMMQAIRQVSIDQLSASELIVRYWSYHLDERAHERPTRGRITLHDGRAGA